MNLFEKFQKAVYDGIQTPWKRKAILLATLAAFILSVLMIAPTKMVLAKMLLVKIMTLLPSMLH